MAPRSPARCQEGPSLQASGDGRPGEDENSLISGPSAPDHHAPGGEARGAGGAVAVLPPNHPESSLFTARTPRPSVCFMQGGARVFISCLQMEQPRGESK